MSSSSHIRVSEQYVADNPGADPSATEVIINALTVGTVLAERMDAVLRPFGLTVGSFTLLTIVAGDDEPLTPTEIARRSPTKVTTATVTGLLDTCQRKGLLQRSPHPSDKRRVLVHLTPAGRALVEDATTAVVTAERQWVGPLSESRRTALLRGLGELRAALEGDPTA
ncbi:MAG TPA: MarR family transcriptional regulator [Acidimicrobiales bacterium]|nr:MarR family transcriptional regulator [Acidimicrobiales bacterium]